MRIKDVLRNKGADVATLSPDATVSELLTLLKEKRIGAVVISNDGEGVDGIVSERDVVMALADHGVDLLERSVGQIMTVEVVSCDPEADLVDLLGVMTNRRFRHVPVMDSDKLGGIVSIGDLVKARIEELAHERDMLESYIQT